MQHIRLIVGLGNPGSKYHDTRHNAGFNFVDQMTEKFGSQLSEQSKFHCYIAQINMSPYTVKIAKPTTFMNLSGQSILALCQFHKIELDQILVAHDELDLPPGVARLKTGGGHNGHNGLRNIIDCFGGNKNFHRLRIGIGHPGHKSKVHNYVLSKPSPDEQISTATSIQATLNFIPDIVKGDFQKVMRELHQKNFGAPNE